MTQKNNLNWRENLEPELNWNQKTNIRSEQKKTELDEPWWYDEK